MTALDRRLHAFRPDLTDARLRGQVTAERFIEGEPARIGVPVADIRPKPIENAGIDTQLILGQPVRVFERHDRWAWVQADHDEYVGYLPEDALVPAGPELTHWVNMGRTFLYSAPDLRSPRSDCLPMGATLLVTGSTETRGTHYAQTSDGWVIANHLGPIGSAIGDYVSIAEMLVGTPYLWGGTTPFGIDCSGLVQLSLRMAGRKAPRDTDMQEALLGRALEGHEPKQRGDLAFWKGHVAILTGAETIVHANGHTMTVAVEELADAVDRIGYLYGQPTSFRRP